MNQKPLPTASNARPSWLASPEWRVALGLMVIAGLAILGLRLLAG